MTIIAIIANICRIVTYIYPLFHEESQTPESLPMVIIAIAVFPLVLLIINYALLMRFLRVQVQIRASKENTKTIIFAMNRSKYAEMFFIGTLLIKSAVNLAQLIFDQYPNE